MAINHKVFLLKKEHIALIKFLEVDKIKYINQPQKLQKESPSPFGGETLLGDLAEIIIGIEPYNNELMGLGDELEADEKIAKTLKEFEGGKLLSRTTQGVEEYLMGIYQELPQAMEIVFNTLSFEPGLYRTRHYMVEWKLLPNTTSL